jgi:glutathione S-transferase
MKIYGAAFSPFVARVRTLLAFKGLEYELELPPGGMPKSPEHVAINPIGKVPTFVDGDLVLPESEVICEYLEDLHPEPALRPADPAQRAQSRLISRVADLYIMGPMSGLFRQMNPATRDQAAADEGVAALRNGLTWVEGFMQGDDYAVGGAMSMADCAVPPILYFVHYVMSNFGDHEPLRDVPRLDAYWMTMNRHPVCGPVLDDMDTTFKAFLASRQ